MQHLKEKEADVFCQQSKVKRRGEGERMDQKKCSLPLPLLFPARVESERLDTQ